MTRVHYSVVIRDIEYFGLSDGGNISDSLYSRPITLVNSSGLRMVSVKMIFCHGNMTVIIVQAYCFADGEPASFFCVNYIGVS